LPRLARASGASAHARYYVTHTVNAIAALLSVTPFTFHVTQRYTAYRLSLRGGAWLDAAAAVSPPPLLIWRADIAATLIAMPYFRFSPLLFADVIDYAMLGSLPLIMFDIYAADVDDAICRADIAPMRHAIYTELPRLCRARRATMLMSPRLRSRYYCRH